MRIGSTLAMRSAGSETRPNQVGAAMHVLVLAPSRYSTIGVDLGSGAFVKMNHAAPADRSAAPRYGDVAIGRVGEPFEDLPMTPTEQVSLMSPLKTVGHMKARQIEKLLTPLHQPSGSPLFGCEGPALPMWNSQQTAAIALIEPEHDLSVAMGDSGATVLFGWRGYRYAFPIADRRVLRRLDWLPDSPVRGRALAEVIGFFPGRILMGLSDPQNGYCYKTALALLR